MSQPFDYVCEKLRDAVLTMMAHRGVPRDRLVITILTDIALLSERDFPDGENRRGFRYMMDRIRAALPGEPSIETYEAAFRALSDDDVRWVIDRLHSLAFSMEAYRATHTVRTLGQHEGKPDPVAGSRT